MNEVESREEQILAMIDRYKLATNAAIQKTLLKELTLNAVTKVTAGMCERSLLRRYPLIPPEVYFTLGPVAVRQLGLPIRRTEPLGPQALPIDYAVLLYATHGETTRKRLTGDELQKFAPWLPADATRIPHCLGNSGLLELIRVDLGGSPQHIAKKTAADCSSRLELPPFRELVVKQRVQFVILTTTSTKARLIRQALEALQWSSQLRLHLAMIPRLTMLQLRAQS